MAADNGDDMEVDDLANMIGPNDHFTKNYPRPLYIRVPSGPNGQTEKRYYKNPVDWTSSESVRHLNRWRAQTERRANKRWGIIKLKRDAVIAYSSQETTWLANELKGDLGEMSYTSVMRDIVSRFQAKFPVPHRTGVSLSSHTNRNAEIRKAWGRNVRTGKEKRCKDSKGKFCKTKRQCEDEVMEANT